MLRTHSRLVRALGALGLAAAAVIVASCGGGGGGGGGAGAVGGGGQTAANQATVTVGQGVQGVANIPTVSVTVCVPGTNACQTVSNVQVDTESFGLRLASSAVSQVLGSLPQQTVAGSPIAECTTFADGSAWGTIRSADVKIAGESAASLPIQIVGDLPQSAVATGNCSAGTLEQTPSDLGANGILGIGVAPNDCGTTCANPPASGSNYYVCPDNTNCTPSVVPVAQQVTNPVSKFAGDNNGVILSMPAIGASGQSSVSGTLTFGIGTQSNNAMPGGVTKLATNPFGDVNATFAGSPIAAFFDSGSNAYFFTDSTIANCSSNSFYCPATTIARNVSVSNYNAAAPGAAAGASVVTMTIGNATQLLTNGNFALNDLAGSLGNGAAFVDVGMPFFYGHTVYYGLDQSGSGGANPFVAF
jgi:hypothetical protein